MKVNDSYLPSTATSGASRAHQAEKAGAAARPGTQPANGVTGDDVQLSELARNLLSLASESPERQAHIEELTRATTAGTYRVDAEATASSMIEDAIQGDATKR